MSKLEASMRFDDRTAIVTGAGSGIGQAIARGLVDAGATVVGFDLNEDGLKATKDELGDVFSSFVVNVSDSQAVGKAVSEIDGPPLKHLVNAAGWDRVQPFVDSAEEIWDRIIATNLKGPIVCTRAVYEAMTEAGGGAIVNIASDAGRVGSSGEVVYSAAKGGVIALTKAVAREWAKKGIRVNTVSPGPTDTPLHQGIAAENPKLNEAITRAIPLRRIAQPDEIAAVVCFLLSDAASYVTGQTLSASGGLTMV